MQINRVYLLEEKICYKDSVASHFELNPLAYSQYKHVVNIAVTKTKLGRDRVKRCNNDNNIDNDRNSNNKIDVSSSNMLVIIIFLLLSIKGKETPLKCFYCCYWG